MGKFIDMKNSRYEKLKVVDLAYIRKVAYWNCICDCGKKRIIRGCDLRAGVTKSCGCINPKWFPSKMSKFKSHLPEYKEDKCWLWKGKLDHKGYGKFTYKNITKLAHRTSYELFIGMIPEGLLICHKCNNPLCVNPKHLYAGTYQDNANDAKLNKLNNQGNKQ